MKKEIRILWDQIERKGEFMIELAEQVNRSPKTLKSHWFSNDPIIGIPADKEAIVIKALKKKIQEQSWKTA